MSQCICCRKPWELSSDEIARRTPAICSRCKAQIQQEGLAFRPHRTGGTSNSGLQDEPDGLRVALLRAVSLAVVSIPYIVFLLLVALTAVQIVRVRHAQLLSAARAARHVVLTGPAWWANYEKSPRVMRLRRVAELGWNNRAYAGLALLLPHEHGMGAGRLYAQAYTLMDGKTHVAQIPAAVRQRIVALLATAALHRVGQAHLHFSAKYPWFYWRSHEELQLEALGKIATDQAQKDAARGDRQSALKAYEAALSLGYRLCSRGSGLAMVAAGVRICGKAALGKNDLMDGGPLRPLSMLSLLKTGLDRDRLGPYRYEGCVQIGETGQFIPAPVIPTPGLAYVFRCLHPKSMGAGFGNGPPTVSTAFARYLAHPRHAHLPYPNWTLQYVMDLGIFTASAKPSIAKADMALLRRLEQSDDADIASSARQAIGYKTLAAAFFAAHSGSWRITLAPADGGMRETINFSVTSFHLNHVEKRYPDSSTPNDADADRLLVLFPVSENGAVVYDFNGWRHCWRLTIRGSQISGVTERFPEPHRRQILGVIVHGRRKPRLKTPGRPTGP